MRAGWSRHRVFLLLALVFVSCAREQAPPARPAEPLIDSSLLDGAAALREVTHFVELGPRDSGAGGAERAAGYLHARLSEIGVQSAIDAFEDETPNGPMTFRNVVGRIPGKGRGIVVLGSHYDTKSGISDSFAGANDSGSSTGLLLTLAELIASQQVQFDFDLLFAFFDGEECVRKYGPRDGLHGSRDLARRLSSEGQGREVRAVVIVDMVGDRDLDVTLPRNSTHKLVSYVFEAARRRGCRESFGLHRGAIIDDHTPFMEAGLPAVDLIDFQFGSAPGKNDYWHTAEDTLDKISAESLGIVGGVVLELLNILQADAESSRLDTERR